VGLYPFFKTTNTLATSPLIESGTLIQADRLWQIVDKFGVNILYTAPTTIRMLMRFGAELPRRHHLKTLRLLGTVGEPINPEAWLWYYENVGRERCPIMDTWWQTETGMFMITPFPISLLKPGSVAKPFPAIHVEIVDREGNPIPLQGAIDTYHIATMNMQYPFRFSSGA